MGKQGFNIKPVSLRDPIIGKGTVAVYICAFIHCHAIDPVSDPNGYIGGEPTAGINKEGKGIKGHMTENVFDPLGIFRLQFSVKNITKIAVYFFYIKKF